jgi:hypothetical protein
MFYIHEIAARPGRHAGLLDRDVDAGANASASF